MKNFNYAAQQVIDSGINERAKYFAEKVVAQIKARGSDWIGKHIEPFCAESDSTPIADNRLYFLQQWQMKLLDA